MCAMVPVWSGSATPGVQTCFYPAGRWWCGGVVRAGLLITNDCHKN